MSGKEKQPAVVRAAAVGHRNVNALRQGKKRRGIPTSSTDLATDRLWSNCLYPEDITFDMYYRMYARNNVAARVIETFPDYSWNIMPVVADRNGVRSRFSRAVQSFVTSNVRVQDGLVQSIFSLLKQLDVLGGIGGEALMLFGFGDGRQLDQPVQYRNGMKLHWVKLLHNGQFEVYERENDPTSVRYGDVNKYISKEFHSSSDLNFFNHIAPGKQIHYTRCVHFKETSGLAYGTSRIQKCYNQLLDIMKLSGASAELYYLGAFSGLSIETDPQAMLDDEGYERMLEETEKYFNGLARSLILEGAKGKLLYPSIVSPRDHFDLQITMISIATGIPRRFLTGAEAAKLASQQDTLNWEGRVTNRRDSFAGPRVMMPAIERCIEAGVLPKPAGGTFGVVWPRTQSLSLDDRSDAARNLTEAMLSYFSTGLVEVIPFRPYLISICGFDESEAEEIGDWVDISKWKEVAKRVNPGQQTATTNKSAAEKKKEEDAKNQMADMVHDVLHKVAGLEDRMSYMKEGSNG